MRRLIIFIVLSFIVTQTAICEISRDENLHQAGQYLSSYSNHYFIYKGAELISIGVGCYGYGKGNNVVMIGAGVAILVIEWAKFILPAKIGKAGECLRRASIRF